MNKNILISIIVVVFILGVSFFFLKEKNDSNEKKTNTNVSQNGNTTPDKNTPENNTANNTNNPSLKNISLEELAKHNKREDCWLLIDGKVYDVSPFIKLGEHPPEILLGCGKDATTLFNTRTTETGQKIGSGKPHSDKAQQILNQYYIGDIIK